MSLVETFLANPIVAQMLGLLIGLFTAFFSWWVLFHWLSPEIQVTSEISREPALAPDSSPTDASGLRYRLKIRNIGRRAIVDLQVQAMVRIRGLADPNSWTWEVLQLPMTASGEKSYSVPRMDAYRKSKLLTFIRLHTFKLEECKHAPYPKAIRQLASTNMLTLDHLLSLGAKSEVRLFVSGYDGFSGARKVYLFNYASDRVRSGRFIRDTMQLEAEPNPSFQPTASGLRPPAAAELKR